MEASKLAPDFGDPQKIFNSHQVRSRSEERFVKHSLVIITAVVALLTALCALAWAINKCTAFDGKVVYQDAPCAGKGEAIDVRPNSVLMTLGAAPKRTTAAPEVPISDGAPDSSGAAAEPGSVTPHT